ncbi:hypothetical protein [Actibacterium lipolyticum]|uniref:Uncharacterized protein n=1 Tax=Actibacterium lipolyticum TaxID=1524263 RepID=A0A238KQU0_9RHOB|nr:hypothetical protein [Actibacterium lipolyticum]SMX45145.1 hypothetical protein COL8621_02728 [Actibacterium lipolyticum]
MNDAPNFSPRVAFWLALALWAGVFAYSFWVFNTVPPTGDGFTRGLNRINGFIGWQVLACALAVIVFRAGLGFPQGSATRRFRVFPLAMAALVAAGILALILWGIR